MDAVNNVGLLGQIGSSIIGILVGIVLVFVSMALLVFNERNAVRDIRANKELAQKVVSVTNDKVDSSKEGL